VKNIIPEDAYYICAECAESRGGEWPEEHVATMHTSFCDICHKMKVLANVGDWNWPDGKCRGMRD